MKFTAFVAGLCISAGPAFGQSAQTDTKYVTVDGEVIRYEAGHQIVIRGADQKELVYTLSPGMVVPADVTVGRRVTLYTEPGKEYGGTQLVSRVTTTIVSPDGNVRRTTEDTRTMTSGATTRTTTRSISGKVEAYEAGKTVTLTRSDGSSVTYVINATSKVPADLMIGKTISIRPMVPPGSVEPVVQTITYVTRTQTEAVPEH
jgi:hypothetical protein